jgi:RAD51-like protein 2
MSPLCSLPGSNVAHQRAKSPPHPEQDSDLVDPELPSPPASSQPAPKHPYPQNSLSIPLVSLALRPSTLTALLRSGFSSTGDVMSSCWTGVASANEDGNDDGGVGFSHANTTINNDGYEHLAKDLGCSFLQAADYAHEIDDVLVSVGLPKVSAPGKQNGIAGIGSTNEPETDTDDSVTAPNQSLIAATAATILTSTSNVHYLPSGNVHNQTSSTRHIVSFSQSIDSLLGGGFALSELTEIVGLPGVGKTQLAMQLCVDSRLPANYGGVEGCSVVIDAEGSWSGAAGGDRLWSMAMAMVDHVKTSAERKSRLKKESMHANANEEGVNVQFPSWLTPESVLEGIHIFRVHDETSQTCTLYNLPEFLSGLERKGTPAKILVIDSMAFHYRVASLAPSSSTGNGKTKSNALSTTHNLTRMAAFLTELASEFDIAVVAMNHLTTRVEKDDTNNQGGLKLVPALGESWAHAVTSRLMIDHHCDFEATLSVTTAPMSEMRTCTLVKSPHKPTGTALFTITDKGIRGVPSMFFSHKQPSMQN